MPPSILPPDANSTTSVASAAPATPAPAEETAVPSFKTERVKLYWAEPVTPPDGPAPACNLDEIRLVEVQGSVNVTLPGGETKTASNGMVIPSGTALETTSNSSVAIFMGGVNSARLAPLCDLTVTQTLAGATRKDTLDLRRGAVFSRIGKRSGEVEDYQVRTPEGSTGAQTPNMLAFRGTADDIPALRKATASGLILDLHRLLAWNPVSFGRSLISDVANPMLGAPKSTGSTSTVFYYAPTTSLNLTTVQNQVFASNQTSGQNSTNANNPNTILQGILLSIAPFNLKLNALLSAINSGNATKNETNFYHSLITVFFTQQVPLISKNAGSNSVLGIEETHLTLLRDLRPFSVPAVTPGEFMPSQ